MRVVFCGNPDFAVPTLEALLRSAHEVRAVVTGADKPRGRGRKLSPLPVKARGLLAGIPVMQPLRLKDPDFLADVRALDPDCIVVAAFRILPRELFALPRLGSFNVHPSLLPRGRGPAPIPWTLLRGERETGVTIIRLSETIDGGDILMQERCPVADDDNFGTLHDRLAARGARLLVAVLDAFERGTPPQPMVQDEAQVTAAPKLYAADCVIHWEQSATEIRNRIRALSPLPGAVTGAGEQRLKILAADEAVVEMALAPGAIRIGPDGGLYAGTGTCPLRLNIVQPAGRRAMSATDFLHGRPRLPEQFNQE